MRKGETAKLRMEAARLCSRIALKRAGGWCEYNRFLCNVRVQATDAAHVLAKSAFPRARYEPSNLLALSREAHELLKSATLDGPSLMRAFYIALRGLAAWDELAEQARAPKVDIRDVVARLRKLAEEIGA
jgi:hypothetical protein